MDLSTLTDDELRSHRVAVETECERRQRLVDAPDQMRDLVARYEQDGGDPGVLADVVSGAGQVSESGSSES